MSLILRRAGGPPLKSVIFQRSGNEYHSGPWMSSPPFQHFFPNISKGAYATFLFGHFVIFLLILILILILI